MPRYTVLIYAGSSSRFYNALGQCFYLPKRLRFDIDLSEMLPLYAIIGEETINVIGDEDDPNRTITINRIQYWASSLEEFKKTVDELAIMESLTKDQLSRKWLEERIAL